jgi:hypothetical protein
MLRYAGLICMGMAVACTSSMAWAAATPEVLAPGVISGPADDEAPAFTPDGKTVYFFRNNSSDYDIMVSHFDGKAWSAPEIAPFSGQWRDLEPAMAPDGSYMIFASTRPLPGSDKAPDGSWGDKPHPGKGGNLWRVDRVGSGWSAPTRLPDTVNRSFNVFSPSIAANGDLYFMEASGEGMHFRLFMSALKDGVYQTPVALAFTAGQWGGSDPTVAPDESFLVYSSNRPPTPPQQGDLFIVYRKDGQWGEPQHLGDDINGLGGGTESRLGPDGHTLYSSNSQVVKAVFPKDAAAAKRSLADMHAWNNGSLNIWKFDISPYLPAPRSAP